MKRRFVFVGSSLADMLGVVSFRRFGQVAELTEEQARDLVLGGSAIVPAEDFEAIGFTPDELKRFGMFGAHGDMTPEFAEKRALAIAKYDEIRVLEEGK